MRRDNAASSTRQVKDMYDHIRIEHIKENNLKDISVEIPYHKHTVIAGVSGSGKSTLAYDVIYATAQRRLLDCMSDQEKIFSRKMKQPLTGNIEGLSTVISLKQVKPNTNPRSTVGTYTSIGSFVRSLTAIHGRCRCLYCHRIYQQTSLYKLIKDLESLKPGTAVEVSFPWFFHKRTGRQQQLDALGKKGYRWVYAGEERLDLRNVTDSEPEAAFLLVTENRFLTRENLTKSDVNSLKAACRNGDHFLCVRLSGDDREGIEAFYRQHGCPEHHMATVTLDASAFSYNDMACACPECMGSGVRKTVHPSKVLKYPRRTLRQGPFFKDVYSMSHPYSYMLLYSLACRYGFSLDVPYEELPQEVKDLILYGSGAETFLLQRPQGYEKTLPNYLAKEGEAVSFPGVLTRVEELYREMLAQDHEQLPWQEEFFKSYMQEVTCPDCNGSRLNKLKDHILLNGKTYSQMGRLEFSQLQDCLAQLPTNETSRPVLAALLEQLDLLREIGLDYLSFHRRVDSLSGGEYQRLRIANQAGAGLVGLTYLIDEPTDGLHGADSRKIIGVIKKLLESGNTVITIEHDLDVIKSADYIIELGLGAGKEGGEIIASGSLEEIRRSSNSIIGKLLSAKPDAPQPASTALSAGPDRRILIKGIRENNIQNQDVAIPLHQITCFTGVSGSGKSTIVHDVLYKALSSRLHGSGDVSGKHSEIIGYEHINNVICIDQRLLNGKNSSVPATYLNLFDAIRNLFAEHADRSLFSFHSKGACPVCRGKGYLGHYIQYFGETRILCPECNGQQYMDEVLQIKYRDRNIKQVLDMPFQEALDFFADRPFLYERIQLVCDLGLGYMQLGQPLSTVSGGEAQRLKLVREMSKYRHRKNLLYLFDEPTIGLHSRDVLRVLHVMRQIVERGNTVVMVEHDPEMILRSDHVIDMGPGAGRHGGKVMFCGSPCDLLKHRESKTADYLRSRLVPEG